MNQAIAASTLGMRVKRLRQLKQLSQQQLGKRASVTPSFLSQLERGKSGASVATAMRLANALGTRFTELFEDEENSTLLTRREDLPELELVPGHTKLLLSPPAHPNVEIFTSTLEPGHASSPQSYTYGNVDEFIIGTGGNLVALIGDEEYQIAEGDVLHFRSSSPHRLVNSSDALATAVVIVTPPPEPHTVDET